MREKIPFKIAQKTINKLPKKQKIAIFLKIAKNHSRNFLGGKFHTCITISTVLLLILMLIDNYKPVT